MNRVSTMIATVLYEACVSPVCEKKVVSLLITAVGQGQIDVELVRKVNESFNERICKAKHCMYR